MESVDATQEWDKVYKHGPVEDLPWYWPQLDPDLEAALARLKFKSGRVLDQGTGPGTQALALAERGYDVTAADLSASAVAAGIAQAKARNLPVRFVHDDVLDSTLTGPFDLIIDRGCFHGLPAPSRGSYVATMHRLLAPDGILLLKTFSHLEPGARPRRYKPEEIHELFEATFDVVEIRDTVFQGQQEPYPKALLSTLRRRA